MPVPEAHTSIQEDKNFSSADFLTLFLTFLHVLLPEDSGVHRSVTGGSTYNVRSFGVPAALLLQAVPPCSACSPKLHSPPPPLTFSSQIDFLHILQQAGDEFWYQKHFSLRIRLHLHSHLGTLSLGQWFSTQATHSSHLGSF